MHPKSLEFLIEVEPVILDLAYGWFPPDKKTPDGLYFYSCTYCDQNFGNNDIHDPDCLHELAKATKEQWDKIDNAVEEYNKNYAGELRSSEEILEIKKGAKYRAFFKHFFKFPSHLVAWDYLTAGKDNKNVVCTCWMFEKDAKKLNSKTKHNKNCPYMRVSKAISKLYGLEG